MANLTNSGKLLEEMDKKADKSDIHIYTPGVGIDITNDEINIDLESGVGISIDGNEISASGMVILRYGKDTYDDFIDAYNKHMIVYCRASRESNPATGTQTRLAFMAYTNSEDDPTDIEFQYYRTVTPKSVTQQGDEVYIYHLNKTRGRYFEKRNAFTRITVGEGLKATYSNGVLTISLAQENNLSE